jgi:hypothetical protein
LAWSRFESANGSGCICPVRLRSFKPTLFLELYGYHAISSAKFQSSRIYPEQVRVDIGFRILEADIGDEYRIIGC